jgi:hypothetical protein
MGFWQDLKNPEARRQRKELERIQEEKDREETIDFFFNKVPRILAAPAKKPLGKPRIVSCPQGIVTYQLQPKTIGDGVEKIFDLLGSSALADNPKPNTTDAKIREMYAANPSIDFRNYEEVLEIKVIRQEYSRQSGKSGIFIGE